jgi:hypothetical protein
MPCTATSNSGCSISVSTSMPPDGDPGLGLGQLHVVGGDDIDLPERLDLVAPGPDRAEICRAADGECAGVPDLAAHSMKLGTGVSGDRARKDLDRRSVVYGG